MGWGGAGAPEEGEAAVLGSHRPLPSHLPHARLSAHRPRLSAPPSRRPLRSATFTTRFTTRSLSRPAERHGGSRWLRRRWTARDGIGW